MSSLRFSPQLRPCIADLLRTCIYPDLLLLRLEKVVTQPLNSDAIEKEAQEERSAGKSEEYGLRKVHRLWLSDGELMIQAVLEQPLHDIFETEERAPEALLAVKRFRVRRAKRIHSPVEVVYLAIADYETVLSASPATPTGVDDLVNEGGFIREETQSPHEKRKLGSPAPELLRCPPTAMPSVPSSQESDGFETADVHAETLARRRRALHELNSNTQLSSSPSASRDESRRKRRKVLEKNDSPAIALPDDREGVISVANLDRGKAVDGGLPGSSVSQPDRNMTTAAPSTTISTTNSTSAPPLHVLSSLVHPPPHSPLPSRNYTCSVLAIVSWCSPSLIYPRHAQSPFPPKRHIKIHDPSIASRHAGITLAVYDNAKTFKPKIGTVALFCGVVMQRWEAEVILNAYARRADQDNRDMDPGEGMLDGRRRWYVDDENELVGMGHDVRRLREWWAERNLGRGQQRIDQQEAK